MAEADSGMVRMLTCRVSADTYATITQIADDLGVSVSEFVREAIDELIGQYR